MNRSRLIAAAGCFVIAVIAFVIGYFSRSTGCENNTSDPTRGEHMSAKERDALHQSIVDLMKTAELRKNMQ